MTPRTITLLCLPVALAGLGAAVHATVRIGSLERDLRELAVAGRSEGESFIATLRGEHAERMQAAFDRRRAVALSLAHARRDRLLGVLGAAAAGLLAGALVVLARIAAEIEEDHRHLREQAALRGPKES